MTPKGIRLNNPLNLETISTPYPGQTGVDGRFAIFATPLLGITQACRQLLFNASHHGETTIRGQVSRWAPPNENDTAAYVAAVSKACGIGPDTPIDVTDASMLRALVLAIIQHENGQQPYAESVIDAAVATALGMRAQDVPTHLPNSTTQTLVPGPSAKATPSSAALAKAAAQSSASTPTPSSSPPMPAILMALLPTILGLFAPRAQAALQKVTQQPPDVVQPFVQSLFDKLGELTGKPDPVQATAAITAADVDAAKQQAVVDALQEHALDYLDKLGPTLDKIAGFDRDRWAAEQSGRESAAQVAKGESWDMTRWLVWIAGFITAFMVVAILVTILRQVWIGNDPSVALIGLGGPLFMAAIQCWKEIFAYRFDGSKESSATNVAMTQMAQKAQQ